MASLTEVEVAGVRDYSLEGQGYDLQENIVYQGGSYETEEEW